MAFLPEVLPPHFVDIHNIRYQSLFDSVDLSGGNELEFFPQGMQGTPVQFEFDQSSEEDEDEENHDFDDEGEDE